MSRPILLGVVLCIAFFGLAAAHPWFSKAKRLNGEETEIRDIVKYLKKKLPKDAAYGSPLNLISEFSRKRADKRFSLLPLITNLNPDICDRKRLEDAKRAAGIINNHTDSKVDAEAGYLLDVVDHYTLKAENVCRESEVRELGDLLSSSASNSNLATSLQLIKKFASRNTNNRLAASIAKLNLEACDLQGLEVSRLARKVVTESEQYPWNRAHPLIGVLDDFERHVRKALSLKGAGKRANLDRDAEIKELGRLLAHPPFNSDPKRSLPLIKQFASSNNKLAASIAKLSFNACDRAGLETAHETVTEIRDYAKAGTHPLIGILTQYIEHVEELCFKQDMIDTETEINELCSVMNNSAFDSNLTSSLKFIKEFASRNSNNKLAASIAKLDLEVCDPAGLKAAQRAKVVTESGPCAKDLTGIMDVYIMRVGKVCLKQASEAWLSNKGGIRDVLRHPPVKSVLLTRVIEENSLLSPENYRDHLRVLQGSNNLHESGIQITPQNLAKVLSSCIPIGPYPRSPSIREIIREQIYEPCQALLKLEKRVSVLEPIVVMSAELDHVELEAAIDQIGRIGTELAKGAGRWNGCKSFMARSSGSLIDAFANALRLVSA